jgi:hypothetical protein
MRDLRLLPIAARNVNVERHRNTIQRIGGADGIIARSLKETEDRPLNSSVYCHLLIFPMSLRNPLRSFGHPHIASFWQQLATVYCGLSKSKHCSLFRWAGLGATSFE